MKKLKTKIYAAIALSCFAQAAFSQAAGEDFIGMVTGSSTGTYIQFGKDIANAVKPAGLIVKAKESKGSLDNIRRMLSRENAALGIVQSDVLGFLTRSPDKSLQRVARNLRLVFPLYNEEVHLFAHKSIKSISDLNGKRVVVGSKGSGNWLTSTNMLNVMQVNPAERLAMSPQEGVTAVLTGTADAIFYVAGKPVKLFSNLEKLRTNTRYAKLMEQTHLVPITEPAILKEYVKAGITPADYTWSENEVPTVAVKAALVSFNFAGRTTPYYRTRCDQLGSIGASVYQDFDKLKKTGHPKWREVDLDLDLGIWQRDQCSARKIASIKSKTLASTNGGAGSSVDETLQNDLLACVSTGKCE